MDHHLHHTHHNPPLYYGYSGGAHPPTQNAWTPPTTRALKRTISESLSDDDVYSEESSKDQ